MWTNYRPCESGKGSMLSLIGLPDGCWDTPAHNFREDNVTGAVGWEEDAEVETDCRPCDNCGMSTSWLPSVKE